MISIVADVLPPDKLKTDTKIAKVQEGKKQKKKTAILTIDKYVYA